MQSILGEDNTSPITDLAARADALVDAEMVKGYSVADAVDEWTVAATGVAPLSPEQKTNGPGPAQRPHRLDAGPHTVPANG
jgi:hypothetical protein